MNKFGNCPLCGKQVKPTNLRKIVRQNQLYGFRMALDGIAATWGRQREFMRWPAYEKMYISAFERMLDARKAKGLPCDWQTGMDVFRWWMEDDNVNGQLSMDDLMEDNNV